MKKFAEFGINPLENKRIFQVPKISIEDILNSEIEVLDYDSGVKTFHGENRYVVKIKSEGVEQKFFTNASPIKESLDQIPKSDYPFLATIKAKKFGTGNKKTYYFI